MATYIHSFIHSRIYKAPVHELYSEAPPAQPRRYRSVLSNLPNALSLFLGRIRISKGSRFQLEGPAMENARRCLVAVLARVTNSRPVVEERRARSTELTKVTGGTTKKAPSYQNSYPIRDALSNWERM